MQKEHVEKTQENITNYFSFLYVIWNQSVPGAFPGHCMICFLFLARGQKARETAHGKTIVHLAFWDIYVFFLALHFILVLFVFLSFLCVLRSLCFMSCFCFSCLISPRKGIFNGIKVERHYRLCGVFRKSWLVRP